MNVVIPMAGSGARFAQAGYAKPKPFIDVLGRPMISHVMENLALPQAKYILIARGEHLEAEAAEVELIEQEYGARFLTIDFLTEGAACTVLLAHRLINSEEPLLLANSDQIVDFSIQSFIDDALERNLDGSILTFEDDDPKWSYARLGTDGLVSEVREKEVISSHATVGIYYYRTGRLFVEAALDMIIHNDRVNNEFYVCPVYNYAIREGARIGIYDISRRAMHGLGTPADLEIYLEQMQGRD